MSEYLIIRDEARRILAELYASIDDDGDSRLAAQATEVMRRVLRVLRRWPLDKAATRELHELHSAIERVRAALPLAA